MSSPHPRRNRLARIRQSKLGKVLNTLVLRGLGSGLAVLLTVFVTRYLETGEAAAFLLAFNITTIAAVCFRWGLDDVIIRSVAAEPTNRVRGVASYLMGVAHRRVLIWAAASTMLASLLWVFDAHSIGVIGHSQLIGAAAISALIALSACAGRIQQGRGNINRAAVILNIAVPGLSLVALCVLVTTDMEISGGRLLLAYGIVALAVYLLVVWGTTLARPTWVGRRSRASEPMTRLAVDRRAANTLGGVVLAQQALNWAALLVVPLAYGDRIFTGFMVTYKVAMLISLVMLAVNFTFSSKLAALFSEGDLDEVRRLARVMVLAVAGASAGAAIAVFLARDVVYDFSNVEVRLNAVLAILVLSQAFFAVSAVFAMVLSMCHDESYLLAAQGAIVGVGVAAFIAASFTSNLEVSAAVFAATYFVLTVVLGGRVARFTSS